MIDYYLANAAAGAVELEITDAQGKTVRHFSSREKRTSAPQDVAIAARWFTQPGALSEQPGMHRFVWDLRYGRTGEQTTADDEDPGMQTWIGPLVRPGAYRVTLKSAGQ